MARLSEYKQENEIDLEGFYQELKPEYQDKINAQAAQFMRNSQAMAKRDNRKCIVTSAGAKAVALMLALKTEGGSLE
jgi:hypothetical protein